MDLMEYQEEQNLDLTLLSFATGSRPDKNISNSSSIGDEGGGYVGGGEGGALSQEFQRVLITLYTVTSLLSIVGNVIVIVVFSIGKRSRSDLRVFLVNLAASDLIMASFCMPFTFTTTMLHRWIFGPVMCTLVLFMQTVSVTASVGTSTAIAVDRYIVVAYPLQSRHSRRRGRLALSAVWAVACALSAVQLVVGRVTHQVSDDEPPVQCVEEWPEPSATYRTVYTFFILLTTYLLPLSVIGLTYGFIGWKLWRRRAPGNADEARDNNQLRSKRKVIKMLVIVVSLFGVCWLPLHIFTLIMDFNPQLNNEDQPQASNTGAAIYTAVHWLAMSNSFVNPIIYGFLNDSFRNDLKWLLGQCFWWCPRPCHCYDAGHQLYLSEYNTQHMYNSQNNLRQQDSSNCNDKSPIPQPHSHHRLIRCNEQL